MKLRAVIFAKIKLVNLSRLLKKNGGLKSIKSEMKRNYNKHQRTAKDHKRLLLHDNKIDNLEEMYKFQEMYNFPGQNQEEIENMSRPITNKTESVI